MKNYGDLRGCYPPRPTASTDNTLLDLHNSSQDTQPHSLLVKYLCYASLFIGPACNIHEKLDWIIEKKVACKIKAILEKNDMPLSLSSSIQLTLHIHTAGCVVGTKTIGSMTKVTSWFIPLDSFHVKHLTEWYNCTWLCSGPSYIGRWVTSSIAV